MKSTSGWLAFLLALSWASGQASSWPSDEFRTAFLSTQSADLVIAAVLAVVIGGISLLNGPRRK